MPRRPAAPSPGRSRPRRPRRSSCSPGWPRPDARPSPGRDAMESLVLRVQGMVDRWSRWMRLVPPPAEPPRRRFLIVQIDGLSRALLDRALARDSLRGLRRLLVSGRLARRDLSVGLPSSTPAFQAAIMYGGRPDIPGFHFYDKRAGRELHFPRRGVADLVERRHADGRAGILEGGACYGCVFTGGAADDLWT